MDTETEQLSSPRDDDLKDGDMIRPAKDSLSPPPSSPHHLPLSPSPHDWLARQGGRIPTAISKIPLAPVDLNGFTPNPISPPSPRPRRATLVSMPQQALSSDPFGHIPGFTPIGQRSCSPCPKPRRSPRLAKAASATTPPELNIPPFEPVTSHPSPSPQRRRARTQSASSLMANLHIYMPYECCCPHCPGYAREGYMLFKMHVKQHLVNEEWICPICKEIFAKAEMTKYMQHLEEYEGFITKKKGAAEKTEYEKWKDCIGERDAIRQTWEENDEN